MSAYRPSQQLAFCRTRQVARQSVRPRACTLDVHTIPRCPTPTCECADIPPGLDIERQQNLNGTVAAYQQHLLVPTGQANWKSRIEDERGTAPWGSIVSRVKSMLGPKGKHHDPYHNVVVSTSSFALPDVPGTRLYGMLFPSFQLITGIVNEESALDTFVRSFLLPPKSHSDREHWSKAERTSPLRRDGPTNIAREWNGLVRPINVPTILICSHNSRDSRCGVLGPLLHTEFFNYLNKHHTLRKLPEQPDVYTNTSGEIKSCASHPNFQTDAVFSAETELCPINVGMISHIGGHKWAGNVIVYIPPDYCLNPVSRGSSDSTLNDTTNELPPSRTVRDVDKISVQDFTSNRSPLAGKGIWYGRVEPKHVEGIVEQTIGHGKIIKELFRGGIHQDGSMIHV